MITPAQCLEARKLLKWSRDRLGPRCELSQTMLWKFETGARHLPANKLAAIKRALEGAGVIFVEENGKGPGVRLRKVQPAA